MTIRVLLLESTHTLIKVTVGSQCSDHVSASMLRFSVNIRAIRAKTENTQKAEEAFMGRRKVKHSSGRMRWMKVALMKV